MANASDIFEKSADTYDQMRRRLIPAFDAFYDTAVAALSMGGRAPQRVLDLGAGTGLLSGRIAASHPGVELTLLDGSEAMLEQARKRLGSSARYVVGDLADPLPIGDWDTIVSALAIHHLCDQDKRELFSRVHQALPRGGIFVNAEQVAGPSAEMEHAYQAWHRDSATALGCSPEQWHEAEERMRADHCRDLETQLRWLRDTGYSDVDCLFKDHRFAVIFAERA